ncbi:DDE_3 domain-containing protein [Trichonephila clavipes]|nr:DDE_3 domain-containing protein [Trichonephila clavipes]
MTTAYACGGITFSWDARSPLVMLQCTFTARSYVDDTLTPVLLPMLSGRPGSICQKDNALPHTIRLSQQFLQGYDVHLWLAGHQISRQLNTPRTCSEGNCSRPGILVN